ncbi:MAG: protein tyrosine phosphatase family protein [Burkholderiaceae bacterium]|nr:protein tyrosine phosphatase family protein [Burkholderiaceae bacterium]
MPSFQASLPARQQPHRIRQLVNLTMAFSIGLVSLFAGTPSFATTPPPLALPNAVEISPTLTTAGQPTAKELAQLGAQGYQAVINLSPPTVSDAIPEEAVIIGKQGLVFINIPTNFSHPTEQDFLALSGALRALAGRKVLVHCQINQRASGMVFLHRVIAEKVDPQVAYKAVEEIWTPYGVWHEFIQTQLKKNAISFQLK